MTLKILSGVIFFRFNLAGFHDDGDVYITPAYWPCYSHFYFFVSEQIEQLFKFDITQYSIGIAGFFILLPPLLYGIVAGFIILNECDAGVLQYLMVTHFRGGYLLYRISMPALVVFFTDTPFQFSVE